MRKLKYTLTNAGDVEDPRKRAQMLATAVLEEAETILLLAKALHLAEKSAREIEDSQQRDIALQGVYRVMERTGYDRESKAFMVKRTARALTQTPGSK